MFVYVTLIEQRIIMTYHTVGCNHKDCNVIGSICNFKRRNYFRGFDKNFHSAPNWLKSYMPTAPQSTMMDQSYSISIEGLNHVAPK